MREMLTFAPLQALYDQVLADWEAGYPVAVNAGQRSGKTTLCLALAARHESSLLVVLDEDTATGLRRDAQRLKFNVRSAKDVCANGVAAHKMHCLLIDEPDYFPPAQLDALRRLHPDNHRRLEIGTSKRYARRYSFATWELNHSMDSARYAKIYERHGADAPNVFNGVMQPVDQMRTTEVRHIQV